MTNVPSLEMETLSFDFKDSPFLFQETEGGGVPSTEHVSVSVVRVNVSTDAPTDALTERLLFNATISPSPDLIRGRIGSETLI